MKVKTNAWKIVTGVTITLLSLTVIWLLVALFSRSESVTTAQSSSIEEISRTVTGNSYSEDVENLLIQTESLLTDAAEIQGDNLEEVLVAIDEGDFSSLPANFTNRFRFVSAMNTEANKIMSYQATLIIASNVSAVNEDLGAVEGAATSVFLDQEAGVAAVPVSAFTGINNGLFFEWIFVDGEWFYSPYSTIQESILASTVTQNDSESTSESQ